MMLYYYMWKEVILDIGTSRLSRNLHQCLLGIPKKPTNLQTGRPF